jgi:integrase
MEKRFNFTHVRLVNLAFASDPQHPSRDRSWVYDAKQPGLCLCVTSAGTKVFYVLKKIDGRTERIRIDAFPSVGVDAARDAARSLLGDIAKGINPNEKRRAARGEMTLAELLNHYIDTHASAHKKDHGADDREQFERYFGKPDDQRMPEDAPAPFPGWRTKRVNTIKFDDVQNLHVKIGEKHGRYSANRMLALLSSIFNNARLANPTEGVKRFKEEQRERFMDADEMIRFRAALDADDDKTMADFFRVLLFTMQRRSNVQAMAWSDVNFGQRAWSVAGEKTKNGDPLVVSLTDEAMEILRRRWNERAEGDTYVFQSYGSTGHLMEPKAAWKRITDRAGITNLRIHDLRHTGASWMAIGGSSLLVIGKALGHRSQQATARYAHVNRTAAATAMQTATAAMMNVVAQQDQQTKRPSGTGKRKKKSA